MPLKSISSPAIPYGSLVAVSGVTGFIGSHVADQALAAGFRVRGTTRSLRRGGWLQDYFKNKYGPDVFELFEVPDMAVDGAFDSALEGVSGFLHVASDMSNSTDPNVVIGNAVKGVLNALRAAKKQGEGMKRFVFTSSSTAATLPKPGEVFSVTADSWNDEAVEMAWKEDCFEKCPESSKNKAFITYAASKTESERAVWKWAAEVEHGFAINTGEAVHSITRRAWCTVWLTINTQSFPMRTLAPYSARRTKDIRRPHAGQRPSWMVTMSRSSTFHLSIM